MLGGAGRTFFDYGCGRGQDLDLLRHRGIPCAGWDPAYRPDAPRQAADVVNLGYVLNVIENPAERADAARQAWELCRDLLVISARLQSGGDDDTAREEETAPEAPGRYRDGVLTSRGTFQKYYTQTELRLYLEEVLGADAIPAAPGVFYVFREEARKQEFLSRRYRRRAAPPPPPLRVSEMLYEQNRDVLKPFVESVSRLGRLPGPGEGGSAEETLITRFGSLKKAFALVRRVTGGQQPWEEIARRRGEDLLVYLALTRFHRRPPFSKLPPVTQRDVKTFFGNYERACREADALLYRAGNADAVNEACQQSPVGQLVENALLIHRSVLERLDPLLRAYEGCARALLGEVENADVVKLHRFSGKVSYLVYQDFNAQEHPALRLRVKVALRSLEIDFFDYSAWAEPPLLESKDGLLSGEESGDAGFPAAGTEKVRVPPESPTEETHAPPPPPLC